MAHLNKITVERNQKALHDLLVLPGNDICADCKTPHPRWASWNLGIFICMQCASIHRKIGTHISKVKSVTLDTWTKEQVEKMKQMGNLKSNAIYNPDEIRHPPPTNMVESERDSDLEKYIRSKYEYKSFFDRSALVASKLGPSRSASSRLSSAPPLRSQPATSPAVTNVAHNPPPSAPPLATPASRSSASVRQPFRSVSHPVITSSQSQLPPQTQPQSQLPSSNPLWNDLVSLQAPSANASLPLQYAQPTQPQFTNASISNSQPMSISTAPSLLNATNPYSNLSVSPGNPFPIATNQNMGISPGGLGRSMSLSTGLVSQQFGANITPGGISSFPQSNFTSSSAPLMTPGSAAPSPNPFAPQALPSTPGVGFMNTNPFGAMAGSTQPQMAFSQSYPQQQSSMQFQQQAPMFQPQPQAMQLQVPNPVNPFMPNSSPQFVSTPQFGNTPSPFGGVQPFQQMQQQQPQQQAAASNPFTSWVQQGQPGGYPSQQQWGGM